MKITATSYKKSVKSGIAIVFLLIFLLHSPYLSAQSGLPDFMLKLSKENNSSLFEIGERYEKNKEVDSALTVYNFIISRGMSEDLSSKRLYATSLYKAALLYYENFNYSKSMVLLLECKTIAEENGFLDNLSDINRNIGNIYSIHKDFGRANSYYKTSLDYARKMNDKEQEHLVLRNIVASSLFSNNIADAEKYYSEILKLPSTLPLYEYDTNLEKGLICLHTGNIDEAASRMKKSVEIAIKKELGTKPLASSYSYLASIYMMKGIPDSALYYLHKNEKLARDAAQMDLLTETVKALALVYQENNNINKSQEYFSEYMSLSDSIFNQNRFNEIKNTQFDYDLEKEKQLVKRLNDDNIRNQTRLEMQGIILWVVGAGLVIFIVAACIIYRQKRKLSDAYTNLFNKSKDYLRDEEYYKKRIKGLESQLKDSGRVASSPEGDITGEVNSIEGKLSGETTILSDNLSDMLDRRIREVMGRIDIISDSSFSIKKLAELVDSNTTYVSKVINEVYGKNFRSFLNEYRIKEVMHRMGDREKYGMLTIQAISEAVGFKSQSSFISAFIKFTGMKPSLYQDMMLKSRSGILNNEGENNEGDQE